MYQHGQSETTDLSIAAGFNDTLSPFVFKTNDVEPQFFWGYIKYRDVFKNERISRYSAEIFPLPVPENQPGKYTLAGSEGWRESD